MQGRALCKAQQALIGSGDRRETRLTNRERGERTAPAPDSGQAQGAVRDTGALEQCEGNDGLAPP